MYETYPKGGSKLPSAGRKGRKAREQETGTPFMFRTDITDTPENRVRQVYGNQYGKKAPAERGERAGVMTMPRKTMISIG